MKTFSAFLLALINTGAILCSIAGCNSSGTDAEAVLDLRKVSDGKISIHDLYDTIEVVPLENAPGGLPLSDLSVTEDRFFLKGGDRLILSYRQDGSLADSLNPGKAIVDYSIYQERILDILFDGEMRAYRLPDLSLSRRSTLDTVVTPTRLARRSDNVMDLPGYKDEKNYLCEYYFDTKKYYASPGRPKGERTKHIVKGMRFLYSKGKLLLLHPDSGWLWACEEFTYVFLSLDFKQRKGDTLEIPFAQVTGQKAYYTVSLNGEGHFLIYDRETRKGRLFKTTREGLSLPLGELRDGINYFCCAAADLPRYLTRDLLSPESASAMNTAIQGNQYVLIKYHLASP